MSSGVFAHSVCKAPLVNKLKAPLQLKVSQVELDKAIRVEIAKLRSIFVIIIIVIIYHYKSRLLEVAPLG